MSNNSENAGDFFPERPAELDPRPSLSFSPRVSDDSASGAEKNARQLIGPAHAHLDAPCTDACYATGAQLAAEHAEQERQAARGDEIVIGFDVARGFPAGAVVTVRDVRTGHVSIAGAEPAHEGSPACRHCAAAIEPYPASGTGWIHALSALVGCGPKGIALADQRAAEPAPPARCICRGSATAVCFDAAGVSCPRGALLHAAAYLPTLDELREQRGKVGQ